MLLKDLLKVLHCSSVRIRLFVHLSDDDGHFVDIFSGPCTYSSPCPEFDDRYFVNDVCSACDSVTIHVSER